MQQPLLSTVRSLTNYFLANSSYFFKAVFTKKKLITTSPDPHIRKELALISGVKGAKASNTHPKNWKVIPIQAQVLATLFIDQTIQQSRKIATNLSTI